MESPSGMRKKDPLDNKYYAFIEVDNQTEQELTEQKQFISISSPTMDQVDTKNAPIPIITMK